MNPLDRLDEFARAWLGGNAPDLAAFLATWRTAAAFDFVAYHAARIDIAERVRAGQRGPVADGVRAVLAAAGVSLAADNTLALYRAEYDAMWDAGVCPPRSDYVSRVDETHAADVAGWSPTWTCPGCLASPLALADETATATTCPGCTTTYPVAAVFGPAVPDAGLDLREYVLEAALGAGGMGEVYVSRDPALGRELAVKVLRPRYRTDRAAQWRFVREARVTAELSHPGVVPVHSFGRLPAPDGRLMYAMRLVRGNDLSTVIAAVLAGGPGPDLLTAFVRVCEAVAVAHAAGIIHRDLKPGNVRVGDFGEVQVLDWGLAGRVDRPPPADVGPAPLADDLRAGGSRLTAALHTQPGRAFGTIAYMPPEQARGERADRRADVFALGAILCEILTGLPPYLTSWTDRPATLLTMAVTGNVSPGLTRLATRPGVPQELRLLVTDCIQPAAAARPADAAAVLDRVRGFERAERDRRLAAERAKKMARRLLALATVFVAAASVAAAGFYIQNERNATLAAANKQIAIEKAGEADRATTAEGVANGRLRDLQRQQGRQYLAGGNPLAALPYFAQPPAAGPDDPAHRVRLGVLFRTAPRLVRVWPGAGAESVVASPDGRRLVARLAPVGDRPPGYRLFDTVGGGTIDLPPEFDPYTPPAFSADGRTVLAVGTKSATVWDAGTGRRVATHPFPKAADFALPSATWAGPGGFAVVLGGFGSDVIVWRPAAGTAETLPGKAFAVAAAPDGRRLAVASDKSTAIWDVAAATPVLVCQVATTESGTPAVAPGGRWFAAGTSPPFVYDADTKQQVPLAAEGFDPNKVRKVVFGPDGATLATLSGGRDIDLWELDPTPRRIARRIVAGVTDVRFTPDGLGLVTASAGDVDTAGPGVQVWATDTLAAATPFILHPAGVRQAVGLDGRRTATVDADGSVRVWEAGDGWAGTPWPASDDPQPASVSDLAVGPDGTRAARVWNEWAYPHDPPTGRTTGLPVRHPKRITAVTFSANGATVATGSEDGTVRVWDAATGRPAGKPIELGIRVQCLALSRDGTRVAAGVNGGVLVCGAGGEGAPSQVLFHRQPAFDVNRAPDADPAVRSLGELRLALRTPAGGTRVDPTGLAFTPDGKHLVTATAYDVYCWDLATGEPDRGRSLRELGPNLAASSGFRRPGPTVFIRADGMAVVACDDRDQSGVFAVWDAAGNTPLEKWAAGPRPSSWHPVADGRLVVGRENRAEVWAAGGANPAVVARHPAAAGAVTAVAADPAGRLLATGTADGRAWAFDAATGELLTPPAKAADRDAARVLRVALTAGGRELVTVVGIHATSFDLTPEGGRGDGFIPRAEQLAGHRLDAPTAADALRLIPLTPAEIDARFAAASPAAADRDTAEADRLESAARPAGGGTPPRREAFAADWHARRAGRGGSYAWAARLVADGRWADAASGDRGATLSPEFRGLAAAYLGRPGDAAAALYEDFLDDLGMKTDHVIAAAARHLGPQFDPRHGRPGADRIARAVAAEVALVARVKPDAPDVWLAVGLLRLAAGKPEAAAAAFAKAAERSPNDWRVRHAWGVAETRRGRAKDAAEKLAAVDALVPPPGSWVWLDRAAAAAAVGDWGGAFTGMWHLTRRDSRRPSDIPVVEEIEAAAKKRVERDGKDGRARATLALCKTLTSSASWAVRWGAVASAAAEAGKTFPDWRLKIILAAAMRIHAAEPDSNPESVLMLSALPVPSAGILPAQLLLARYEKLAAAEDILATVAKLKPNEWTVLLERGRVRAALGRAADATVDFAAAADLAPPGVAEPAAELAAVRRRAGDWCGTYAAAARAIEADPRVGDAVWHDRVFAAVELGDADSALRDCDARLAVADAAGLRRERAYLHAAAGRFEAAAADLYGYFDLGFPDDVAYVAGKLPPAPAGWAAFALGLMRVAVDDWAGADAAFTVAAATVTDPRLDDARGHVSGKRHDHPAAAARYAAAAAGGLPGGGVWQRLGAAYRAAKQYPEAYAALATASARDEHTPEVVLERAKVLHAAGDPAAARASLLQWKDWWTPMGQKTATATELLADYDEWVACGAK